jgi:NADH:ubiquinone oxidoreductase subunit E
VVDLITEVAKVRQAELRGPRPKPREAEIESILSRYDGEQRWLINILFDVQAEYRYLPREVLEYLSRRMNISLAEIYGIATFYKAFTLTPRGKHEVTVCLGTACHVRGSINVLEDLQRTLKVKPGGTTEDGEFSLETVNCLGACALGPVVVVDGEYHGQMSPAKVKGLLDEARKKG